MAKKERRHSRGMGCLVLKGKTWFARWVVDGKVFIKTTETSNKRKAEAKLRELTAPFRLGDQLETLEAMSAKIGGRKAEITRIENEKPALKISQAWDAFLKSPERSDAGERTLKGYACQWKRFEEWIGQRHKDGELRDITASDAADYAADLTSDQVTPNTFNKHIVLLEMIFRVLTDTAKLVANPWIKIKRKRLSTQGRRAFTAQELKTILESATGELQTLLIIGAYSGLRLGDAVTLDWKSVDLDNNIITLKPKKTASRTGKLVAIPIHPTLHLALAQTPTEDREGAVLPELAKMREENPDGINYRLKQHFKACHIATTVKRDGVGRQVAEAGFHALRHTIVSQLASRGVPLETVRGLVGHGGETMTRAYVHQNAEAVRAAVEALPALAPALALHERPEAPSAKLKAVLDQLADLSDIELEQLSKKVIELIGIHRDKPKPAPQSTNKADGDLSPPAPPASASLPQTPMP